MQCAVPRPSIRSCLIVIGTCVGSAAWIEPSPRELEPTIVIESETSQFNFGLQVAAAGPLLAVEDLVPVDHGTSFQLRIGRVRDGAWHEEARFPVGGWLHGMALSRDAFAWRAGNDSTIRFARFANGRWKLAETVTIDDERCYYVPELGKNLFLDDNVVVLNSAANICVFERQARAWRLAKVFPKSAKRELVVYAAGRVITAIVGESTAVVHTRTRRGWDRSEIALPFHAGWTDIAASRRWLVLPTEWGHELYVFDLENGGTLAAHLAPTERSPAFGDNFAIDDQRLLVDDYYDGPYLYAFRHGAWQLDARLQSNTTAGVELGDVAWVSEYRFGATEPGRIAGFALD